MKQGDRRKDRGQYQAVQPNNVGLYRSVSSPGTISNYERDVERREVVVGGYGVPLDHLVYPGGIPAIQSPSVTIFNSGIQDKDAGVKGRKRPGRKTRQGDGYGSSPDGHASPPRHQNGDMREGSCRLQAERMAKEAPMRGTNNYASLLSSPSPSSIPNPTFKPRFMPDSPGSPSMSLASVPLSSSRSESNSVQFSTPSSPKPEFVQRPDVNVKMGTSLMSDVSPRFEASSRESVTPLTFPRAHSYSVIGPNVSKSPADSTPEMFLRFSQDSLHTNDCRMSAHQDSSVDSSSPPGEPESSCLPHPSLYGGPFISMLEMSPDAVTKTEGLSNSPLRPSSAIGIPKLTVKQSKATKVNDITKAKKYRAPAMGSKQPPEKGLTKGPVPGLPSACTSPPLGCIHAVENSSHWKMVSGSLSEERQVTQSPGLMSTGPSMEGILGSPNWSRSGLLGSPYGPSRRGGMDPGNGPIRSSPPLYQEHWCLEEVNQAMEAGQVLRGTLRINPHNRSEAYVTIDCLPLDILIDGSSAQNRSVDGDVVAVLLDEPSTWPRVKGGNNRQSSSDLRTSGEYLMCCSEVERETGLHTHTPESKFSCDDFQGQVDERSYGQIQNRDTDISFKGWEPKQQTMEKQSEEHGGVVWHECQGVIPSGGIPGQMVERQVEPARTTVLQILKRSANESATGPLQSQQHAAGKSNLKSETADEQTGGGSWHPMGFPEKENNSTTRSSGFSSGKVSISIANLSSLITSFPGKRPAGRVVSVLEYSPRREAVVGFLERTGSRSGGGSGSGQAFNLQDSPKKRKHLGQILLVPVDNRCPKMMVLQSGLPDDLRKRVKDGDPTVSSELLAACVDGWRANSYYPVAIIQQSLGQRGNLEAQQKAILHEHGVNTADFSSASLACLPKVPWKIPTPEMKRRTDLRHLRILSIDPPTARDLDDALSIEALPGGAVRIGVHIADVSYFVRPDTALDKEAKTRSTTVYLMQKVLPMLPRLLCEDICSLNPGADRLAFSVMWEISPAGDVTSQWIGRTVIRSCAKLTYDHAQDMIDGKYTAYLTKSKNLMGSELELPNIYGTHTWTDVVSDVCALHEVAMKRRTARFDGGALKLNNSKLVFSLDEDGVPCDSMFHETKDSNSLVEEFMLLANITVARVISSAFPDRAILRRHPEPNLRKLKEFEDFCSKTGLDLDASSAGSLHISLEKIQACVEHDPVLFKIIVMYATKAMQLAKYFCTGELKNKEEEWAHYALATPLYTHFTSPIRRYLDIIVHRVLAAALEVEEGLVNREGFIPSSKGNKALSTGVVERCMLFERCFSSTLAGKAAGDLPVTQQALALAALKHKIPGSLDLALLAAHCNNRHLASRNVKEASDKLYVWTMLKNNQGLLSDARVLALGPKFMSLHICRFNIKKRIYYEDIEGVTADWFEATGTLVLDIAPEKSTVQRRPPQGRPGRPHRTVADIATLVNPADSLGSSPELDRYDDIIREVEDRLAGKLLREDEAGQLPVGKGQLARDAEVEPTVFPLTLRLFSAVPVSLHAIGGDKRLLDIVARLYVSSYSTALKVSLLMRPGECLPYATGARLNQPLNL